jgi:hypothetical protein
MGDHPAAALLFLAQPIPQKTNRDPILRKVISLPDQVSTHQHGRFELVGYRQSAQTYSRGGSGISGAMIAHCSSVNSSRRAIALA